MAVVKTSFFTNTARSIFYLTWIPGLVIIVFLLAFDERGTWWSATWMGWMVAQLLVLASSAVLAKIVDYNLYMRRVRRLLDEHPEWKGLSRQMIENHMRDIWFEDRPGEDF